jgi:hypothetical protein
MCTWLLAWPNQGVQLLKIREQTNKVSLAIPEAVLDLPFLERTRISSFSKQPAVWPFHTNVSS